MKKIRSFFLGFVGVMCMQASAYDFSAVSKDPEYSLSETLYYSINADSSTVTVTEGPKPYSSDIIIIPATVEYEGKTYTVTTIGYRAFAGTSIKSVRMADSIEEIQSYAFERSKVEGVTFSKNLKIIGNRAFDGTINLKDVTLYAGVEKIGDWTFSSGGLQSVTLPASVNEIGEAAFSFQHGLRKVTLPANLKELKKRMFDECSNLEEVVLPDVLEVIGEQSFFHTPLKKIDFPSSLKEIGAKAFTYCQFSELVLPNNIETLGKEAFFGCPNLTSIVFSKGLKIIPNQVCSHCSQLVDVNIPEGVTTIEYQAFSNCERLSHVDFPESVTTLGDGIFNSSAITRFTFPSHITKIPDVMFAGCSYLHEFSIPNTITEIGNAVFRNCDNLRKVEFPESVCVVGDEMFDGCVSLEEVVLPTQLKVIPKYMFRGCEALSEIELPKTLKEIQDGAFSGCISLNSIVLPNGVETIGTWAFNGCSSLIKITIPHSVTFVGYYSLGGCKELTEVHMQRAILPKTYFDGVFDQNRIKIVDNENVSTLYVPRGAKATYEVSSVWNNFMAIEEEDVPNVYYQLGAKIAKGYGEVIVGEENIVYNKVDTLMNSAVTVTFVPAEQYMIETVLCNGEDITAELSETNQWEIVSVEANYEFEVYYKELPVTLHLVSGLGGSVDLKIEKGNRFACNFQPEEGWIVNTILFNSYDVTAEWNIADGYVTPNITAESTLSVSFEQTTAISKASANSVKAYALDGELLVIEGLMIGETVEILTSDGVPVRKFNAANTRHAITLAVNEIYIVKTLGKTIKVAL